MKRSFRCSVWQGVHETAFVAVKFWIKTVSKINSGSLLLLYISRQICRNMTNTRLVRNWRHINKVLHLWARHNGFEEKKYGNQHASQKVAGNTVLLTRYIASKSNFQGISLLSCSMGAQSNFVKVYWQFPELISSELFFNTFHHDFYQKNLFNCDGLHYSVIIRLYYS